MRDLQHLLTEVGKNGGAIGPSVYDTAMVARLAPPKEGPEPALDWLLQEQRADGGWCSPRFPVGRDLPTLAAVLALRSRRDARAKEACAEGLAFLRKQAGQWTSIPDDLPIALELTLPALVSEAIRLGVDISDEPYRLLAAVGEQKRQYITRGPVLRGTPPAHAWEALGLPPTAEIVDAAGSVGASPAATAVWIGASLSAGQLQEPRKRAIDYLRRASLSTGVGIPGVVSLLHPAERFEQAFALFGVLSAGLFDRAEIADPLGRAVDELASAMTRDGIGLADVFMVDGDDTFVAVAVLRAAKKEVDIRLVRRFEGSEHFFVYPGERNPSPSANAHALYALSFFNDEEAPSSRRYLAGRQHVDGRFLEDKWQTSWLYTTHRAILALRTSENAETLSRARDALLHAQEEDGGFGAGDESTAFETAHGLLALRTLREKGCGGDRVEHGLLRAYRYLRENYRPFGPGDGPLWIGKELYAAPRIDRAFLLSAMLCVALEIGE